MNTIASTCGGIRARSTSIRSPSPSGRTGLVVAGVVQRAEELVLVLVPDDLELLRRRVERDHGCVQVDLAPPRAGHPAEIDDHAPERTDRRCWSG